MITTIWPAKTNPEILILDSREAILALRQQLKELAARCSQPGAMHWLPYFLHDLVIQRRSPLLVLFVKPGAQTGDLLQTEDLQAAALFSEYRLFGVRTGAVATEDAVGFRTVIAPESDRAQVAAVAARTLIQRGADVVLATFEVKTERESKCSLDGLPGVLYAHRTRLVGRSLHLQPTFDATLAQLGKSTRFNLRYYRRRLEKQVCCEFVAEAAPLLRQEDFKTLNANSLNPVPDAEFQRRIESASELPGSFLMGLRLRGGPWLSLVGGWRQGSTTVLHWQMNSAGREKDSIGTVMRSYLLEHEIAQGARELHIHGGTAHSMRHAFEQVAVTDLVLRRQSLRASLVQAVARLFVSAWSVTGRPNFLAETLRSPDLRWTPVQPPKASRAALTPKPLGLRKAR